MYRQTILIAVLLLSSTISAITYNEANDTYLIPGAGGNPSNFDLVLQEALIQRTALSGQAPEAQLNSQFGYGIESFDLDEFEEISGTHHAFQASLEKSLSTDWTLGGLLLSTYTQSDYFDSNTLNQSLSLYAKYFHPALQTYNLSAHFGLSYLNYDNDFVEIAGQDQGFDISLGLSGAQILEPMVIQYGIMYDHLQMDTFSNHKLALAFQGLHYLNPTVALGAQFNYSQFLAYQSQIGTISRDLDDLHKTSHTNVGLVAQYSISQDIQIHALLSKTYGVDNHNNWRLNLATQMNF